MVSRGSPQQLCLNHMGSRVLPRKSTRVPTGARGSPRGNPSEPMGARGISHGTPAKNTIMCTRRGQEHKPCRKPAAAAAGGGGPQSEKSEVLEVGARYRCSFPQAQITCWWGSSAMTTTANSRLGGAVVLEGKGSSCCVCIADAFGHLRVLSMCMIAAL